MKVPYIYPVLSIVGLLFFIDLVGIRIGGLNIFYIMVPIVVLVFAVMLIMINTGKIKIDGISSYYLLLLLFFFYISIINSSFISLRYSILIAIWFLLFFALSQVIVNIQTKVDASWVFLKVVNTTLLAFISLSLIQHIFYGVFLRLYGFNYGLGPNEMALYSATGLIISAQLLNKFKKSRYYISIGIFFVALILTGSRTSILAIAILLLFILFKGFIYFKGKISRRYLFLFIILFAFSPFIIYYSSLIILRFYDDFVLALKVSDQILLDPRLTSYRLQGFIVAKEILIDSINNFFVGVGFESYRVLYSSLLEEYFDGSTMTIHSVYLQIIVGGGIATFSLFLLYLYKLIEFSLKLKDHLLRNTILYLTFLNLFYMLLGSTFVNRLIYFIIPTLVYLAFHKQKFISEKNQKLKLSKSY